jgi:hypothetical protein
MIVHYNIEPIWDNEFKTLNYVQEQFNDPDQLDQWKSIGFQNVATGYMCDMRSPQPSWNNRIVELFVEMGWKNIGTSYYRMGPGSILPTHRDLYKKYVSLFNLQGKEHTIRRAVIFLENWKPGQYAEYENSPFINWQVGATVEWEYDALHMAANVGVEDRYTLQITGHK